MWQLSIDRYVSILHGIVSSLIPNPAFVIENPSYLVLFSCELMIDRHLENYKGDRAKMPE